MSEDYLLELIAQNEQIIELLSGIAQFTTILTTLLTWLTALIAILVTVVIIKRVFGFFFNRI